MIGCPGCTEEDEKGEEACLEHRNEKLQSGEAGRGASRAFRPLGGLIHPLMYTSSACTQSYRATPWTQVPAQRYIHRYTHTIRDFDTSPRSRQKFY